MSAVSSQYKEIFGTTRNTIVIPSRTADAVEMKTISSPEQTPDPHVTVVVCKLRY